MKLPDQMNRLKLKLKKLKLKPSEMQSILPKQNIVLLNTTDHQQLIPFPRVYFPLYFHITTGINLTYHLQLCHNHASWIMDILQIIKLLVSSFLLKYIRLVNPSWHLSIHFLSFILIGDNISCFRSFLYLSLQNLSSHSPFLVSTTSSFPNYSTFLSPLLNTQSLRLFTTISNSLFFALVYNMFIVQHDIHILLTVNNTIVDLLFPVPKVSLNYGSSIFDGFLGIPFTESLHTTHIHAPRSSEILILYNLIHLIPLYPPLLSLVLIRSLVLHILSLCLSRHLTDMFLSKILPPPISPPIIHQYISSYFTLQPILALDQ